jgi:hypothetical protein
MHERQLLTAGELTLMEKTNPPEQQKLAVRARRKIGAPP